MNQNKRVIVVPQSRQRRAPEPDLLGYPLTDAGHAERLVKMFGTEFRYCADIREWLVWDVTRWKVDQHRAVWQFAKRTMRIFYGQATGSEDEERYARNSENVKAIRAMLTLAETDPKIIVNASVLDSDGWLLNCKNGTVDLGAGMDRGRLSRIERGRVSVSTEELARIEGIVEELIQAKGQVERFAMAVGWPMAQAS